MRYNKLTSFHSRRKFDPTSKIDLLELKYFLTNNKWRNVCPFYVEYPWEDIPAMCKDKYATFMLSQVK